MTMTNSRGTAHDRVRSDGIDLLRGLAILFVLMNHVNMQLLFAHVPYTRALPPQLTYSLVWNGQQGVQIFFAISGFLITSTSLRRWGSLARVSLREFYLLRFARIAPLLLLLLAVLSLLHIAGVAHFIVSAKTGGLSRALLAAFTFRINVLEATRGYLPGSWDILWSLSVEEMFYFFFPLACRLLGRGKLLIALLVLFVLLGPFARTVLAHGNEVWQEYSYLGSMDAIALGALTAILTPRLSQKAQLLTLAAGLLLMIFCLAFSLQAYRWGLGRSGLYMSILALGACLVILVAAQANWRSPRLLAPLRMLGSRSYEVYLTHIFLVLAFFSVFVASGKRLGLVLPLFVAVFLASGLLGEVVARFYSEPINQKLRRHWLGRVGGITPSLEPAQTAKG